MYENDIISELSMRTGASPESVRYAYEQCGGDFAAAEELILRQGANLVPFSRGRGTGFNSSRLKSGAKSIFEKLLRNELAVNRSRELFSMPLMAVIVLCLFFWDIIIPAMLISLFFGVSYTFRGPDISKELRLGFKNRQRMYTENENRRSSFESFSSSDDNNYRDNGFFN